MTGVENVGVFIREKVWLENSLSRSAQAIFKPNFFPYKYTNILNPSHSSYLPAYEGGTECSETLAYKIQTSENYPEGKGKAVPLQAWSGLEGSRKLRFPDYMTTAQDGGKVVSLTHRPPLPQGNAPGTHFC